MDPGATAILSKRPSVCILLKLLLTMFLSRCLTISCLRICALKDADCDGEASTRSLKSLAETASGGVGTGEQFTDLLPSVSTDSTLNLPCDFLLEGAIRGI